MRMLYNSHNPSNSKNLSWDKNRDLQDEIQFYLEEKENADISKTRIRKPKQRQNRWNDYKHHVICHWD